MIRTFTVIALVLVLLAVSACGGGDDSDTESFATTSTSSMDAFDMDVMTSESGMASALQQPAAAAAPEAMEKGMARDGRAAGSPGGTLQFADRKIISTGNITVEVDDIESSVAAVEAIADGMGGYVEVLSRSGGDDFSRASLTIRVPQGQFASAYDRIRDLGEVLNEHQGSEDVSEQFIDLEARLNSALREEQSYLSLLGRTSNVSEVLAIERELARVRADIERYQGQLDFLTRRVDLSTIYVELVPEEGPFIEPPNGYLRLTVDDVPGSMDRVRNIIASYEGEIRGGTIYSNDGEQRADLDARVFYADFRNVLSELERVGNVASKSIQEPVLDSDGGVERDPEARVFVHLEEPDNSWLYVVGAVIVLGALLLVIVVVGVRGLMARSRRRAAEATA